ncbi:MAG: Holliday junction resolvase RuvX [Steroidobacteraceae bacterium]
MPETRRPRVVLAFDFGLRRIGIAAGDTLTRSARPLRTVAMHDAGPDWAAIDRELAAHAPALLVVGTPYNDDGTPARLAPAATAFAASLAQRYRLQVERVDERYSSTEAASRLREQRAAGTRRRAVRKEDIDSAAAAIFLDSWLAQND